MAGVGMGPFLGPRTKLPLIALAVGCTAVALGWLLASGFAAVVTGGFAAIALLTLFVARLEYAVAGMLALGPFYTLIKGLLPPPLDVVWWDALVVLILVAWALRRGTLRAAPLSGPVFWLGLVYVLWGVVEIFVGPDLLLGMFGFRSIFLTTLLLFPFIDVVGRSENRELLYRVLIAAGLLVAIQALMQFLLLNAQLISPGSSIDTGRLAYMENHQGYAPSPRFGFQRGLGPFPDPGQTAVYLAGVSILFTARLVGRPHRAKTFIGLLIVILGLIATLASWSLIVTLTMMAAMFVVLRTMKGRLPALLILLVFAVLGGAFLESRLEAGISPLIKAPLSTHYSSETLLKNTANLRGAFLSLDLTGEGLQVVPASLRAQLEGTTVAEFGSGYFFLDDIVVQIGLGGIFILLALWITAIVRAYQGQLRGPKSIDSLIGFSIATVLLLASQHYGAPIIHGPDVMLLLMWAIANRPAASVSGLEGDGPDNLGLVGHRALRSRAPIASPS